MDQCWYLHKQWRPAETEPVSLSHSWLRLSRTPGFTETRGNGPVPKHKLFPSPNDLLRGSPALASGQFNISATATREESLAAVFIFGCPLIFTIKLKPVEKTNNLWLYYSTFPERWKVNKHYGHFTQINLSCSWTDLCRRDIKRADYLAWALSDLDSTFSTNTEEEEIKSTMGKKAKECKLSLDKL